MDIQKYKAIDKMARNTSLKPNGWNEWAKYVLLTLEEQSDHMREVDDTLNRIQVEVAEMRTKIAIRATIMGAIAGVALSVLTYLVIEMLKNVVYI